jgi:thiamine-phosphate pyrophosphorylase
VNAAGKVDLRLCVITDAGMIGDRYMERVVVGAIDGGATVVQYREKSSSMRHRYEAALALCGVVKGKGVPFIVNDHVDLALGVGGDGVHLGQDDLPAAAARRVLPDDAVVGVSVGSVAEAIEAESEGADYVSVGPLYATGTKPDAGAVVSREVVRGIVEAVNIPVIAIGGINASNVAAVMCLGVSGVAVVSAVMTAEDPRRATRRIVESMRSARSAPKGSVWQG